MRALNGWIVGLVQLTASQSLVRAATFNVECRCITSVSKFATPLKYVIPVLRETIARHR